MGEQTVLTGEGFLNIRGDFRIGGVVNVGTQCSLVETGPGSFVFLDSYTLPAPVRAEVDRIVGNSKVTAILNLHPFHTIHCEWMHGAFPNAKLYGTSRHLHHLPQLPWQDTLCESQEFAQAFASALEFSVPDGVDLVSNNDKVHFSSVLAFHPASGTIHADDTLSRLHLPGPLGLLPLSDRLDFHPTLAKALKPQAGAADAFRNWAISLGEKWQDARYIATAHNSGMEMKRGSLPVLIAEALERVRSTLDAHRKQYG